MIRSFHHPLHGGVVIRNQAAFLGLLMFAVLFVVGCLSIYIEG
jgi:hypothetical protein